MGERLQQDVKGSKKEQKVTVIDPRTGAIYCVNKDGSKPVEIKQKTVNGIH